MIKRWLLNATLNSVAGPDSLSLEANRKSSRTSSKYYLNESNLDQQGPTCVGMKGVDTEKLLEGAGGFP